jgi:acyl carrier protein
LQTVLIRVLQPEDAATISADVAMADLGLDSIAAAEIRNFVLHDLALELPIAAVFDARTPARLNEELLRRLQAALLLDKNTAKAGQRQQEELEDQETWTL